MSEWQKVRLGDVATRIGDGIHGTPQYDSKGDYYFINGNNLVNGCIVIKEDTKKVSKDEYRKHYKPLSNRTILFSINGTIGSVAIYNGEKCMLGKSACYVNLDEIVDKRFIYYTFLNKDFQNYLLNIATGTTILNVPIKGIREYEFMLPPLSEQERIAGILGALDDKTELNNRINRNLEEQAQALFKRWFVDFEFPDHDGNPYRTGGGEMIDSPLGEIPKGWKVGRLDDLILVKYGKDHKLLNDGNIPVYGSGGIMRYVNSCLYDKESVLIPRKGTLNNVIYINRPFWSVDTMFYSKMKYECIAKFVYFFLKVKDLASMNTGSAVPSMTTEILNQQPVAIAPNNLYIYYDALVSPIFEKMQNNISENQVHAEIRNSLLPKLMNNEIEI